jgi:RHH-type rel operon transcriptional repressor/antitoxin RelB
MAQSQKKLNINVSFEGEFAKYLIEMAEIQGRTVAEIVKDLVEEELEASKMSEEDDEIDEADIALAKLAVSRNVPSAKRIKYEDVKWR